jgi:ribosomal-protein-alanine N-acetyltransferase
LYYKNFLTRALLFFMLITTHLRLVPANCELTQAGIENKRAFSSLLKAVVPTEWPPRLLPEAELYPCDANGQPPDLHGWLVWYVILEIGPAKPTLIGSAGFKGKPSAEGQVEIGYAILEKFQRRGFGYEATQALIDWAFKHPAVKWVIAETYPLLTPSIKLMKKCGMHFMGKGSQEGIIRYGIGKGGFSGDNTRSA